MADRATIKRADFLYRAQAGLARELEQVQIALEAGRMSVRIDFVSPTYTGPHDIPLAEGYITEIGAIVRRMLRNKLDEIEAEIKELGFEI